MTPLRRLLGAFAVTLAVALGVGAGPAARAQDAPDAANPMQTPPDAKVIDDLVGCIRGSRHLVVLFLIDESGSLSVNDPDARRVDAALSALDRLTALAGNGGPAVDVAVSAFSFDFAEAQDWTSLDAETAPTVAEALEDFRTRDQSTDTDFVNALVGAREYLADRTAAVAAESGETPCKAILLFTDGGYDIGVREDAAQEESFGSTKPYAPGIDLTTEENVREVEALGREEMCRPGGVADKLRGDRVKLLTLALTGDVSPNQQRMLAAASAGSALGATCGTESDTAPGAYYLADGIDSLIAKFDEVATRLSGGTLVPGPTSVPICGDGCDDASTVRFELDGSVRQVHLLALAAKPGTVIEVEGPTGSVTIDGGGKFSVGEVTATAAEVAGRGLVVDLARPEGLDDWSGQWSASIVDPSGEQVGDAAVLQAFVFSDLTVTLSVDPLQRGTTSAMTATVAAPDGVDLASAITAGTVEVRFVDPVSGDETFEPIALQGPASGPYIGTVDVPATVVDNALVATAELRATIVGGAEVVSQSSPTEVAVRRIEGAIQFGPPSLQMPALEGEGATSAELILVGGIADGCVWFGPTALAGAPDGIADVEVTVDGQPLPGEGSCLELPAGTTRVVEVEVAPDGRGSGTVSGDLVLFEKVGDGEASTTEMSFRFDMSRGIDEGRRRVLAAGLLAGGLAVPVLLLYLINTIGARFQRLDAVAGAAIPVLVRGQGVYRVDGPRHLALELRGSDFTNLGGTGDSKRFVFGGVQFRARASRNPFGATIALAAPEGGAEKLKGHAGSRVELDPSLAGSFVFLIDADATRADRGAVHGTLICFVADGEIASQTSRMLPEISRKVPTTAVDLAKMVREAPDLKRSRSKSAVASEPEASGDGQEVAAAAPEPGEPAAGSGGPDVASGDDLVAPADGPAAAGIDPGVESAVGSAGSATGAEAADGATGAEAADGADGADVGRGDQGDDGRDIPGFYRP